MSFSRLLEFDKFKLLSVTLNSYGNGLDSSKSSPLDDVSDFCNVLLFHQSFSPDELKEFMLSNAGNECLSNVTNIDSTVCLFSNNSIAYVP